MGLLDRISFKPTATEPPDSIELGDKGELVINWPGGPRIAIPAVQLRDQCPCANCIEEGTGRKILDPAQIPADIRPLQIAGVGNYALKIQWSDGHDTGIYTWQTLRRISGLEPE
jgi:DUF971 family protein